MDPVVWPGLGSSDEIRLWFVVGGWFGVGVSLSVSWVVGRPDSVGLDHRVCICGCEAVGCRVIV